MLRTSGLGLPGEWRLDRQGRAQGQARAWPRDLLPSSALRRLTTPSTATIVLLNGQYGDHPFAPDDVVERMRLVYSG